MKEGQPTAIQLKDYQVPPFLISETALRIELGEGVTHVTARLKMRRNPESEQQGTPLVLDGAGMELQSVAIDERQLNSNEYGVTDENLTLYDLPGEFLLETTVAIKPQHNTALEGLYKSGDMFCTQCEAEGFRNITYYLDRPDVMSRFKTTIVADKDKYPILLSNGNDVARGETTHGQHWVTWEDPFMKPAYLFALVAGDLQHIEAEFVTCSGRKIKLQIFTEPANIDKLDHAMASLQHAMAWDERVYGREYDLDIFMIVAVDSFNMGAMENKGLNIFNTSCVLARPDTTTDKAYQRVEGVVAHEYFHNWSGNRVTCRDWFQLSLKEGFTVFRDQGFSADMGSATVCRVEGVRTLRDSQFPEDAGPMAHPIRPESYIEINNFYTTTVYEKGAEVVRMIHTLLGAKRFRKGTDLYFERHDGQAVTTDDFVNAMEDANAVDLSQFKNWYSQAGTPELKVDSTYNQSEATYTLSVRQSCEPSPGQQSKQPYQIPFSVGLLDASGGDMAVEIDAEEVSSIDRGDSHCTFVLNVTRPKQDFVFNNVPEEPVPSLLRGFSAPVKLVYDYSRDDLMFLMRHDADGFNRWEAGQRLAVAVIQDMVMQIQAGHAPAVDDKLISTCSAVLEQSREPGVDREMIADMLTLPSEGYLAELAEIADVDAIHRARELVRSEISVQLRKQLLSIYKQNSSNKPYAATGEDIARRALKNLCLSYLMQTGSAEVIALAVAQCESADNMTDVSSAIRALVDCPAEDARQPKEHALKSFYDKWRHEPLVIDQWFSIQALCPLPETLDRVEALLTHAAFDNKVPNRLRALVASFTRNVVNFHDTSGRGYRFLADSVIELNSINPILASRILNPLTRWHKYDARRQQLMRHELERILAIDDLSKDVFEIASKSV
ncbi:MAG: aminopeptidase N [Gammaproteobacteria bacterium]|nr:aminopeptidase N [Gammaproteobacteria bacterium]